MLISCPNCETQFAVPETALGQKGRNLKCARCAHKWFQAPPRPAEPEFEPLPDFDAAPPTTETAADAHLLPGFENFSFDGAPASGDSDSLAEETVVAPPPRTAEPIPEALGAKAPRRTAEPAKGGGHATVLWVLLAALIILGGGAYAVFTFQDRVIAAWPDAARYLESLGLRREVVGAGLTFRNSSSERLIQGEKELLVVRGVIANVTEQTRDVPLMRLALYDNQTLVQDKVARPPVDGLDPGGTAAFRVVLEQPHPMATRFEVTFTEPAPVPAQ